MDFLFVRRSVWNIGRSVKNVQIKGLTFIQLLHSHLVHIPLLRVQLSWGCRDSLADVLLKNEIKPFLIMV